MDTTTPASTTASRLIWLLRIAAAMCFIGHGAFGIITKAAWVPYFGVAGIPEAWAWKLMPWVGMMDIGMGILALVLPDRWLWAWMSIWAVWTAALRPLSGDSIWETLERGGNYCVPAALLLLSLGKSWPVAVRALRWGSVLLLLGHGMLAWNGKAMLIGHWHALLPMADAAQFTRATGAVELMLALLIAIEPTATLGIAACVWKVATESLFIVAGAPVWEFIERGGSYFAPLVMGLWFLSQRRSLSANLPALAPAMRVATIAAFCFATVSSADAQDMTPGSRGVSKTWSKLDDGALLKTLRAGGQIILFRHCATDWSQEDRRDLDITKRENQRNLSNLGKEDAQALGAAFKKLGIPHATARSSVMFRTRETAELAFGTVEQTRDLMGRDGVALKKMLMEAPPAGQNAVLFTHQHTILTALPEVKMNEIEEGNCLIIKPGSEPERIAHLAIRDWERLADMPSRELPADLGDAAAMQKAATALLAGLAGTQHETLTRPFDSARTRWAYTPEANRVGVPMREMSPEQRELVFALIGTALTPAATQAVRDTMSVERRIAVSRNGAPLGPDEFHVTLFGKPDSKGDWAWRVEGHHVALNFTVQDSRIISATPFFLGAFPAQKPDGTRLLIGEQDLSRKLLESLTDDQRTTARVGAQLPISVMTGNTVQATPLTPAGLSLPQLTSEQGELVQRLIATFINRLKPTAAESALARIKAGSMEKVSLATIGGGSQDAPTYWRVQGPTFVIEFLHSLKDTTHVHTVWRDFEQDFGSHITGAAPKPATATTAPARTLPTIRQTFSVFDANQDGVITADEPPPQVRDRFMRADINKDGRVTKEELIETRKRAGLPTD
jgi:hypothetical protein